MEKVEKLSAKEAKDLEEEVSVPYRVEDVTVLSEGRWNDLQWTAEELEQAIENTDFSFEQERGDKTPPNSSLYYDHEDRSAESFVGRVENVRMEGKDVKSDLVISDKQTAMNLEFGAPFGVSPKADGLVDENRKMQDFQFENFSLVVNPAVKTTWLNEDITAVLQDMEIHRPKFNGTSKGEWSSPNLEEFTDKSWSEMTDSEKKAVGRHFMVSKSGFPAEKYGDLALPVVEPNGDLNLNALRNAKARVNQVSGIDEDGIRRVGRMINNLANGNFDDADFEEVDMSGCGEMKEHDEEKMAYKDKDEDEEMSKHDEEMEDEDEDRSESSEDGNNNSNEDIKVKTSMTEEQETEAQEPETEESPDEGEETVENSDDFVTAEELEDFKTEVLSAVQELGDEEDEEDEDGDVEESEASDEELSEFEEFRQENPDMSLSEAAEEFEQQNRDVEDKIEEMSQKFEEKISDLEEKLESKEEEVEELSEKVENPQRATQASDDGEGEDIVEKVSELSDDELHAQVFKQLDSQGGVRATKEMIHNG